ncbi:MAG TPA: P-II family nitrogen regulator [Polyangiaceae bacterium]|nr:P-II family nitrogen regulator [Polyangiaceae bacterium]
MTKVQALIRQDLLSSVVERLLLIGVHGLTTYEARGFGRSGGKDAIFRGTAYRVDFIPKAMVEWWGADDEADAVVRAIQRTAATGRIGDGKIFVSAVEDAVRIRTGERGEAAL